MRRLCIPGLIANAVLGALFLPEVFSQVLRLQEPQSRSKVPITRTKPPQKKPRTNSGSKTTVVAAVISIKDNAPSPAIEGHPVNITYTLSNPGLLGTLTGVITGEFQGNAVMAPNRNKPQPISIAPKTIVEGTVRIALPHVGTARLTLAFEQPPICTSRPGPTGKSIETCQHNIYAQTTENLTVLADLTSQDLDLDGIPDALEDSLLARYRPYYRVSNDGGEEPERPTDPIWYIRHSTLLKDGDENSTPVVASSALRANSEAIFTTTTARGSSNFQVQSCKTQYFLNPDNDYRPGFYNGDGTDWQQIVSGGGLGLYGHVARDPDFPNLYRIEYWQFYGFNLANASLVANHEGDWEGITVIVDSADPLKYPDAVIHYVHGKAIRFSSISQALKTQIAGRNATGTPPSYEYTLAEIGPHIVLHGSNWNQTFNSGLDVHNDGDLVKMQDSVLELYCTRLQNQLEYECTHPVVYVEWGTHASWPTPTWTFIAAPNHNGTGAYQYLNAPPRNLGETWAPRGSTPGADIILNYNGHWGAFSRSLPGIVDTSPPLGPALHSLWARPRSGRPSNSCLE
jgi:hypothetical protein